MLSIIVLTFRKPLLSTSAHCRVGPKLHTEFDPLSCGAAETLSRGCGHAETLTLDPIETQRRCRDVLSVWGPKTIPSFARVRPKSHRSSLEVEKWLNVEVEVKSWLRVEVG
jgi:hypothetical protein